MQVWKIWTSFYLLTVFNSGPSWWVAFSRAYIFPLAANSFLLLHSSLPGLFSYLFVCPFPLPIPSPILQFIAIQSKLWCYLNCYNNQSNKVLCAAKMENEGRRNEYLKEDPEFKIRPQTLPAIWLQPCEPWPWVEHPGKPCLDFELWKMR